MSPTRCHPVPVAAPRLPVVLSILVGGIALTSGGAATATAETCPDVEVVYARGTDTTPPVDFVGQAFVNAFSAQIPGRTISVYGVDYPATLNLGPSTAKGAAQAWVHIVNRAAECPATQLVLSGYSQGAAVIDLLTADKPLPWGTNTPMPAAVAGQVAAIAVFGNPSRRVGGGPITAISKTYGPRSIDLCITGDPFCSNGSDVTAHAKYGGVVDQAAKLVAARLR